MSVKQSLIGSLALVSLFAALAVIAHYGGQGWSREAQAQTPTAPQVKTVVLAKDQKLKDANWHCYAGGYCELWLLTQPRKPENKAETYVYQNADGSRQYVIKEQ